MLQARAVLAVAGDSFGVEALRQYEQKHHTEFLAVDPDKLELVRMLLDGGGDWDAYDALSRAVSDLLGIETSS